MILSFKHFKQKGISDNFLGGGGVERDICTLSVIVSTFPLTFALEFSLNSLFLDLLGTFVELEFRRRLQAESIKLCSLV